MKIKKPWSWVASAFVVVTMPLWIVPLTMALVLWVVVYSVHRSLFED